MSIPESHVHIEDDIKERSDEAWNYTFPVRNQNFAVMSIAESDPSAIKIYGVYSNLDEANKASSEISKANDFFNVYVADTNAWLPIPPNRDFIENIEYQEKRMMEIKNSFTALKERNAKNLASSIKRDVIKVEDQVEDQVGDQVEDQVQDQVEDEVQVQ